MNEEKNQYDEFFEAQERSQKRMAKYALKLVAGIFAVVGVFLVLIFYLVGIIEF